MSTWELSLLLACGLLAVASPILPLCVRDLRRELRRRGRQRRRRTARRSAHALKDRDPGGAS